MAMLFDSAPFNEDTHMQSLFLELKEKHNIKTVIETGTYHGRTTEWLCKNFDNVSTIEVNPPFFAESGKRLYNYKNVKRYKGSSADLLGKMIEDSTQPLLIFLDAHWWANPVLKELDQIAESKTRPVLVIHDFKNPHDLTMGYDIYPDQGIVYEWKWIADKIVNIYGEGGCLRRYNTEAVGARRGALIIEPH